MENFDFRQWQKVLGAVFRVCSEMGTGGRKAVGIILTFFLIQALIPVSALADDIVSNDAEDNGAIVIDDFAPVVDEPLPLDGEGIGEGDSSSKEYGMDAFPPGNELSLLADEEVAPSTQPSENSASATSNGLGITVTWDDPACGVPTTFHMQGSGGTGTYSYYLNSVEVETEDGWNWIVDPSRILGYDPSDERTFTFFASGRYLLRFFVMDVNSSPKKTTRVLVYLTISDPAYPSVDEIAESVVSECERAGNTTDYEKALWLHDWVVDNCSYDYGVNKPRTPEDPFVYCGIEGALSPRQLGTCESYYSGYALLLKKAGIKSGLMIGNGHVWNAVMMDGEWYQVDPTWDDPGYASAAVDLKHLYFGLTDEIMVMAHSDHRPNAGFESNSLANNYFVKSGKAAEWADALIPDVRAHLDTGEISFEIDAAKNGWIDDYKDIIWRAVAYEMSHRSWLYGNASATAKLDVSYQGGKYSAKVVSCAPGVGDEYHIASETPTVTTSFMYDGSVKTGVTPSKLGHFVLAGTSQASAAGTYSVRVEPASGYAWDMNGDRAARTYQWTISKASISGSSTTLSGVNSSYAFTGASIQPPVAVKCGGRTLQKDVDYDVAYVNNLYLGRASVVVTGKGNYTGQRTIGFDIVSNSVLVGPKNTWKTVGGKTYYYGTDCRAVKWGQRIGGSFYYFNGASQMQTGWLTWNSDGAKSYFGADGRALTGWQKLGGRSYYFDPSTGKSLRWGQRIGGSFYYFNGASQMQTGWLTWNSDGAKSYFGADGRALTGWQKLGGRSYYFDPSTGKSLRWGQRIGGSFYYFNGASQMQTGWLTWNSDKKRSYFDASGKALSGWQTIGGQRYYFDPHTYKTPGAVGKSIAGSR